MLSDTMKCCKGYRHEFVMPEHLLMVMMDDNEFYNTMDTYYSADLFQDRIAEKLEDIELVPENIDYEPEASVQLGQLLDFACAQIINSSATALDVPHLVMGLLNLPESWACYLLKDALGDNESSFMSDLISAYELIDQFGTDEQQKGQEAWRRLVTCMNTCYKQHNPLIGREQELQRTIQVLCRRDKNNPLHVGEPGVGKTALVWGLARMIEEDDNMPERLKGSKIYQIDLGTLLAGTQYRGDFENRIKQIMEGIQAESDKNIVYIDEIHTLVGAGATGEGAMDASNMLKPYLEAGGIRFIGSTTYEEYNRHFSRSKGLVRRFQQIDIPEPTLEEAKNIVRQLSPQYEAFHHVTYDETALDFAVDASYKYVNDRFLPDKAIDLIDEAGAALEVKGKQQKVSNKQSVSNVTKTDIADVLAKTCKVEAMAINNDDDNSQLETLSPRLLHKIYGQDEAIRQVVEAVQMSKAGLLDDNKPLASLLFVGPTGVGKTEVARVLAKELGITLLRFDMSEYTEKHTVAKLIGSPAGYVGYEDGGLLTDAIRKTPNCVLLLDEIEKAHQDIYNILLQVMDYARLTDNKGRKADFRNVILIMTSNAGAQYATQANIGFTGSTSRGEAMLKQVKKIFKPEFINRLSSTVVFNDMDYQMASLILKKKLGELQEKLTVKQVEMTLSDDAFKLLLDEGYTREYGAREMDRVIAQRLKPLLMREILFGSMKQGGHIIIGTRDGSLSIG
ncbi:MAG: ATP-dependent Clp protease ATP-binding subunit ClpA [Prevotella ruminicola]|uniref:ATP-dependent Clp protease ATP-binding subunit ClpA n=1 Tax=Xylanibacter ruminicola TaxID=839 RepID=A0A9D5P3Y2_XYLRU|nr:ATP-dependent Clp protease ATP-binding subunit ClpA [Xylanibacter ruminicola]